MPAKLVSSKTKGNHMYNKEIETSRAAWEKHQENLKANASKRLAGNAKWNRENKSRKKSED
jgi:hypothetical protein